MLKQHKIAGFTLLEVMLAMTLLSIMVSLLFASLKISAESWNKGEAKIAEVNEKAVVYQFFKRHLPSIKPVWDEFSEDERTLSFQGERDKFQFVSVFPASAGRKGLQLFEVIFDKAEDNIKVILKPFYPNPDEHEWQQEDVILLEQVTEFKISYFAKDGLGSEGEWHSSWTEKEQLPALIKIKIGLAKPSFWPEMVFALKLTTSELDFNLDTK